ncbi:MAG: cellulase family glycosylhydrolase [Bdellovibrionales bacterium]|nr:cellulase family glycosylhydrolase [Bdellovibrionales bacterium]
MQILLKLRSFALFLVACACVSACTSETRDLLELETDPPSRKPIDVSRTGVNNFFVDREFGSIPQQYSEIRNTLGLRYVRVLFAWTDDVQPSPNTPPDYNFYDNIIANVPSGVDVLITVVHTPSWMASSSNWINGDPRVTWVERWLRPTVQRYAGQPGVIGWQIWNEPDNTVVPSDSALQLTDPQNYFDLLALGSQVVRSNDPTRLVVSAASRSIQQNSRDNLNYNKQLQDLGAENLVDIWAIHYYGEQFEQVIISGGVADFVNSLRVPVWVTESGEQGPDRQLQYVETVWPFLDEEMPGKIQRFYYYQFGETGPPESNFGLRMNGPVFVSNLYTHLSER